MAEVDPEVEGRARATTELARKELVGRSTQTEGPEKPAPLPVKAEENAGASEAPPDARAFSLPGGQFSYTEIKAVPTWYLRHLLADQTQDGVHWNDLDAEQRNLVRDEVRRRSPGDATVERQVAIKKAREAQTAAVVARESEEVAGRTEEKIRADREAGDARRLQREAEQADKLREETEAQQEAADKAAEAARDRAEAARKRSEESQKKADVAAEGEGDEDTESDTEKLSGPGSRKAKTVAESGAADAIEIVQAASIDELDNIEKAEKAGKDRSSVGAAIEKRRKELSPEDSQ